MTICVSRRERKVYIDGQGTPNGHQTARTTLACTATMRLPACEFVSVGMATLKHGRACVKRERADNMVLLTSTKSPARAMPWLLCVKAMPPIPWLSISPSTATRRCGEHERSHTTHSCVIVKPECSRPTARAYQSFHSHETAACSASSCSGGPLPAFRCP